MKINSRIIGTAGSLAIVFLLVTSFGLCSYSQVVEDASREYEENVSYLSAENDGEKYGYESLDPEMKRLYDDIVADAEALIVEAGDITGELFSDTNVFDKEEGYVRKVPGMTYSINDYDLTYEQLVAVFAMVRNCHPEYYFISSAYFRDNLNTSIQLTVIDTYSKAADRQKMSELIQSELSEYLAVASQKTGAYEKALAVHNMLVDRIDYAYDLVGHPETAPWAHNIVGAVSYAKGTCETYAKWYSYVLSALDIGNYIVTGESKGQGHAWNLVQMDNGKWYNVDVTWNDTAFSSVDKYYEYFASPKSKFDMTHVANTEENTGYKFQFKVPQAADDFEYNVYYRNRQIPDYSSRESLQQDYYEMWKSALDGGSYTLLIYIPDAEGAIMLSDIVRDFSTTVSKLIEMGYGDYFSGSLSQSLTVVNNTLFIVTISEKTPEHQCYGEYEQNGEEHWRVCAVCGSEYSREEHTETEIPPVEAGCTTDGSTGGIVCKICGYVIIEPEIIKAQHVMRYVEKIDAGCNNYGVAAHYKCDECDGLFEDADGVYEVSYESLLVAMTEHIGGNATCNHKAMCEKCGEEYGSFGEHNYNTSAWEYKQDDGHGHMCALCGEVDLIIAHQSSGAASEISAEICLVCQYVITPATGHIKHILKDYWVVSETHHWRECEGCTEKTDLAVHTGGTSNCQSRAECSVCKTEYGQLLDHVFDKETVNDTYKASDAGCTVKATYYYSCECGAKGSETFENGEELGHIPGEPATENTPQICTACGEVLTLALGHMIHTPNDSWEHNDICHWHPCQGCSGQQLDKSEHSFVDDTDPECDCGYVRTVANDKSQTVDELISSETDVKINVSEGSTAMLDPNMVLQVVTVNDDFNESAKSNIEIVGGKKARVLVAYEISLLLNGIQTQPGGRISVTLPVSEKADEYTDLKVVCIDEQGKVTAFETKINEDGTITFVTDHFGCYAVIAAPAEARVSPLLWTAVSACVIAVGAIIVAVFFKKKKIQDIEIEEVKNTPV